MDIHANIFFFLTVFQSGVLALNPAVLDTDQVENLIKFCPTKEEMDMLRVSSLIFKCILITLFSNLQ